MFKVSRAAYSGAVGVVYRRDAVFFDNVQKRSDVTGGSQLTTSRVSRLVSAEILSHYIQIVRVRRSGMSAEPGMWR